MITLVDVDDYINFGLISRQKVIEATKRSTDYLAHALEKTREYCERELRKRGMPSNGTNAYVTWRNMTTLSDGRVSNDISIDFRIITIGNKEAARDLVNTLVPDESKISALNRDLMGDFDISYVMGDMLFKQGGEWKLDSEDMENSIHWMTEPALKIFSDVAFKGFDYCNEMFGDKAVEFYLIERKTKCLGIPEMDYFCDVYKG